MHILHQYLGSLTENLKVKHVVLLLLLLLIVGVLKGNAQNVVLSLFLYNCKQSLQGVCGSNSIRREPLAMVRVHCWCSVVQQLLQHVLRDWHETWHIKTTLSVDVQNTFFVHIDSSFRNNKVKPPPPLNTVACFYTMVQVCLQFIFIYVSKFHPGCHFCDKAL